MQEKKTALLLIAHGSRRTQSNEEVKQLADKIAAQDSFNYSLVEAAFLEIAEPSIPDGLKLCMEKGAKNIVIFPYFLSAGRHVTEDIPAEVAKFTKDFPQIEVSIGNYLGCLEDMPQIILKMLNSAD